MTFFHLHKSVAAHYTHATFSIPPCVYKSRKQNSFIVFIPSVGFIPSCFSVITVVVVVASLVKCSNAYRHIQFRLLSNEHFVSLLLKTHSYRHRPFPMYDNDTKASLCVQCMFVHIRQPSVYISGELCTCYFFYFFFSILPQFILLRIQTHTAVLYDCCSSSCYCCCCCLYSVRHIQAGCSSVVE